MSFFTNMLTPALRPTIAAGPSSFAVGRGILRAPRMGFPHKKEMKGRIKVRSGGSTKGSTLVRGDYGLRVLEPVRLTARVIEVVELAIQKKLKGVKTAKVILRAFPNVPVCVKGNEARMGRGKGAFDHWEAHVPLNNVIFEIGGEGIRPELAKAALTSVTGMIPVRCGFVKKGDLPRVGYIEKENPVVPDEVKIAASIFPHPQSRAFTPKVKREPHQLLF